jgi:hypothetical protein
MKHSWIAIFAAGLLSAGDPLTGAWKLNYDKSPGITGQISKFEKDGDFIKNTNTAAGRDAFSYRFKMDGKAHAVDTPGFDSSVWRRVGSRKYEHETSKGGKPVYSVVTEVAPDGKTRTYRNTRASDGVAFEGVQDRVGGEVDPANPLIGAWRLRQTMERSESGGEMHFRSGTLSYSAKTDGKDYPVKGSTTFDSVAVRRLDSRSIEISTKKEGKPVATWTETVSPDGKTLTTKRAGRPDLVFDRVK